VIGKLCEFGLEASILKTRDRAADGLGVGFASLP
jgi:hypothetical protein